MYQPGFGYYALIGLPKHFINHRPKMDWIGKK